MTFRTLLPPTVATFETREDMLDVTLFPSEAHSLGRAVEKRRREFITGRACARAALAHLGFDPVAIATGSYGEPLWPAGIVGSITHCRGYRASAVANVDEHGAIGIDAEVHAPLPAGVLEVVASPARARPPARTPASCSSTARSSAPRNRSTRPGSGSPATGWASRTPT